MDQLGAGSRLQVTVRRTSADQSYGLKINVYPNGTKVVVKLKPGGPAAQVLRLFDKVVLIGDVPVGNLSHPALVELMRSSELSMAMTVVRRHFGGGASGARQRQAYASSRSATAGGAARAEITKSAAKQRQEKQWPKQPRRGSSPARAPPDYVAEPANNADKGASLARAPANSAGGAITAPEHAYAAFEGLRVGSQTGHTYEYQDLESAHVPPPKDEDSSSDDDDYDYHEVLQRPGQQAGHVLSPDDGYEMPNGFDAVGRRQPTEPEYAVATPL